MKTILVLDDETAVRESLTDYFEDHEWRVLPAASAEEALDIVTQEKPDGAVVDIRLPGMDGNGFILEAARKHPDLAFVISTGSPEYLPPEAVGNVPQVSDTVFSKPVSDLAALERALRRQIEKCGSQGAPHGQ